MFVRKIKAYICLLEGHGNPSMHNHKISLTLTFHISLFVTITPRGKKRVQLAAEGVVTTNKGDKNMTSPPLVQGR